MLDGRGDTVEDQEYTEDFSNKLDTMRMRLEILKQSGALVGKLVSPISVKFSTPPAANRSRSLNVSPVKQRALSPDRFIWSRDVVGERAERAVMSNTVPDDHWEKRLKLAAMQGKNVERASALEAMGEMTRVAPRTNEENYVSLMMGKELGIAENAVGGRGQRMSTDAMRWSLKDPEGPRSLAADRTGGAINGRHSYSVVGREVKPLLTDEEKLELCLADIREQNRLLRVQKRHLRDEVEATEERDPGAVQTMVAHSGMCGLVNRTLHKQGVNIFRGATTSLIARSQSKATRRFEAMPASRDLRMGGMGGATFSFRR
jgi:hypothetical protein